jgi:hypothetical protein
MGVNALYLPVGYHEKLELIEQRQEKDIDVLFYGCVNERRKKVLDELAGTKLVVLFGKYGKERDELIARSKIILNIHFYERKILEVVRISYLLNNGCFVVSEESEINPYSDVKITIGPYGDLANICRHYLSDYKSAILTGKNNYMLFKEKHIMDKGLKQILQPYIVL